MAIDRAHVASLALGVLAITAAAVGVYAVRNPNGIQMGAAPGRLGGRRGAGRRCARGRAGGEPAEERWRLFAVGMVLAGVAVALLGYVAFVLSFNQL